MKLSTYAMKLRKKYNTRTGTSFLCTINNALLADLCYSTTSNELQQEYRNHHIAIHNYIKVQLKNWITIESLLFNKYKICENLSLNAHKFRTELLENMIKEFKEKEEEKK